MSNVVDVQDVDFVGEVLKSEVPVLVDFWAPWCAPCLAVAPLLEELADEYKGKLKVVKVNVDGSPKTAGNYGVRSIPNLLLFKGGVVQEQFIGGVKKSKLVGAIARLSVNS